MSTTTPTGRLVRTTLTSTLAAALVLGGSAVVAPTASADSAGAAYTCTSPLGTTQMSVTYESPYPDPPAVYTIGVDPRHDGRALMRLRGAVPGPIAQEAASRGAVSMFVNGDVDLTTDINPLGSQSNMVAGAETLLEDQTTATDVPFEQSAYYWIVEPGAREIRADTLNLSIDFRAADGSVVWGPVEVACSAPARPVIDTVLVRSASVVSFTMGGQSATTPNPVFAYGERVPVEASVVVKGRRPAAGWVDFRLGGVIQRVALDAEGTARTSLAGPADRTATNPVVSDSNFVYVSYVPADPRSYQASDAYPRLVPVTFAPTKPRVRVKGKDADRATRVQVRVEPAFDSSPTGKVRINLFRRGSRKHWTTSRTVDRSSRAVAGFGKLRPGRYKVVVKYRGDDNHLGSRTVRKVRVRR